MGDPENRDDPTGELSVGLWKTKKLITELESYHGKWKINLISLAITPAEDMARTMRFLNEDIMTLSGIRSRMQRLTIMHAIQKILDMLKSYDNIVPAKGLVVYCGRVLEMEKDETNANGNQDDQVVNNVSGNQVGQVENNVSGNQVGQVENNVSGNQVDRFKPNVSVAFEPPKPVSEILYKHDDHFHLEVLRNMVDGHKFGFIVVTGNEALLGSLTGNTRHTIQRFNSDLPKTKGDMSPLAFARLRLEKRQEYMKKVGEIALHTYITNGDVNCNGLILAGTADFKNELNQSGVLDSRLLDQIIDTVAVSYDGENGFQKAVELSADCLHNFKFPHEKEILRRFSEAVAEGRSCSGVDDTVKALELKALEAVIVIESLDVQRLVLKNEQSEEKVKFVGSEQKDGNFFDDETNSAMDVVSSMPLIEWLVNESKTFGAQVHIVSCLTTEGLNFCQNSSGVGGILNAIV